MTDKQRKALKPGKYEAVIQSEIKPGHLNYAELFIPGQTDEEIFFSTYICHPSMANNELSGPILATAIARWVQQLPEEKRHYSYRFVFAPETIGAITYISKNLERLKEKTYSAFNLSCVGDPGDFSFLPSRKGGTVADRVALHALNTETETFKPYKFLNRGSDERHYCSPGVDLPMVSIMRTKYGQYPEYHTSLDNLDLISQEALEGTLRLHQSCIEILENNKIWKATNLCEPHLSRHNLYPDIGLHKTDYTDVVNIINFLAYADGKVDLIDLADTIEVPAKVCIKIAQSLREAGLIEEVLE